VSLVIGKAPSTTALTAVSPAGLGLLIVVAAFLPASCEEALFRGAIQGVLERGSRSRAIAITAVLFGLFHLDLWAMIPAVFLGLVFGTLVARTGSTMSSSLAHFGNNAAAVTVGFLLNGKGDTSANGLLIALTVAFVALVPLLWRLTRGVHVAPSPLASVPAGLA
jgi:membrane protease YdiL (CAAX protease family)